MYERSAIVLERYFDNLLQYDKEFNIRNNFAYYCDLVDKLEKYQLNYQSEISAIRAFNEGLKTIKAIQTSQDRLYKRGAKLEYNRNLLFGNIEGKVEDIRECIEKIEAEVEKNNEEMKKTKERLLAALEQYNDKRFELAKCKRNRKISENAYEEALEVAKTNFEAIPQESIDILKQFNNFDDKDSIMVQLEKNGKGEKIPFNQDVIENATSFGLETAQKEAEGYLVLYDKMAKLLTDIDAGTVKIGYYNKYLVNEKVKMEFLLAVKDYIVQFLDYERMAIIYGQSMHSALMVEACENFKNDQLQINNLYKLLVKETLDKATKKSYKDLYNQSYLMDMQKKEESFNKEKNSINLNTATLINSNYWRINGIKDIYTIFYKNVSEVFGRDIAEFELPKESEEEDNTESVIDDIPMFENNQENIIPQVKEEVEEKKKIPFKIEGIEEDTDDIENDNINEDENEDEDESNDNIKSYNSNDDIDENIEVSENSEDSEDSEDEVVAEEVFDIFGEKYKNIDFLEKNIGKDFQEVEKTPKKVNNKININKFILEKEDFNDSNNFEETEDEETDDFFEDDIPYEMEKEEENLFGNVKPIKRNRNYMKENQFTEDNEDSESIMKKIRKISGLKNKKTESDII